MITQNTAAELLLKRGPRLLGLGERRLALANGDAVGFEPRLQVERLRDPPLEGAGLFGELGGPRVQFRFPCLEPLGLGRERLALLLDFRQSRRQE